jgi:glucose-1-phosphate cytidylyltransferase
VPGSPPSQGPSLADIPVVILCGGMGMRLAGETEFKPKPMVKVGPHPILWHLMKIYGHHGCRRFILCLGYRMESIKEWVLNYRMMENDFTMHLGSAPRFDLHGSNSNENWEITCADTGLDTMTGGRIHRIAPYVQSEHFFATYGDGLADIDIRALFDFHVREGRIGTVTGVTPDSRFGVIESASGRKVDRFREKPQLDSSVSGGFFVFKTEFLSRLDPGCVLEQEPLAGLAADGQLSLYRHRGFWKSMDTYRDFVEYNDLWKRGETPWKVW